MEFLEVGSLVALAGCALAKWVFTHQVDALMHEIERDRKTFRSAREALRTANSRKSTIRQELAKTRQQVAVRHHDLELLTHQMEQAEAMHEADLAEFARLKETIGVTESFVSPESRAIFG